MHTVTVTTAVALTASERESVRKIADKKIGNKEYELREVIDEKVVGGIRLVVNGVAYDATVKAKLDALKA